MKMEKKIELSSSDSPLVKFSLELGKDGYAEGWIQGIDICSTPAMFRVKWEDFSKVLHEVYMCMEGSTVEEALVESGWIKI